MIDLIKTKYGQVTVSNNVLADIAAHSAAESYGVVGLARKSFSNGIKKLLKGEKLHRGVSVVSEDNSTLSITLYIVVEYGVNLVEVSKNLIEKVSYDLKKYSGYEVKNIDVVVQGVTQ